MEAIGNQNLTQDNSIGYNFILSVLSSHCQQVYLLPQSLNVTQANHRRVNPTQVEDLQKGPDDNHQNPV